MICFMHMCFKIYKLVGHLGTSIFTYTLWPCCWIPKKLNHVNNAISTSVLIVLVFRTAHNPWDYLQLKLERRKLRSEDNNIFSKISINGCAWTITMWPWRWRVYINDVIKFKSKLGIFLIRYNEVLSRRRFSCHIQSCYKSMLRTSFVVSFHSILCNMWLTMKNTYIWEWSKC